MNTPLSSHRRADAARLAGVVRLIRRICVMREQDEAAAAAQLEENELANAVRDIRLAEGAEVLSESGLQALFATEERRVADAMVLAELLVPRLTGSIPVASAAGEQAVPSAVREAPVPFSKRADAAGGSPAIPDLLDAMLAADSSARRQSGGRRAN